MRREKLYTMCRCSGYQTASHLLQDGTATGVCCLTPRQPPLLHAALCAAPSCRRNLVTKKRHKKL
jgi:hypothetical protein